MPRGSKYLRMYIDPLLKPPKSHPQEVPRELVGWCGSKLNLITQVLVYVSTYQGNPFWNSGLLSHSHMNADTWYIKDAETGRVAPDPRPRPGGSPQARWRASHPPPAPPARQPQVGAGYGAWGLMEFSAGFRSRLVQGLGCKEFRVQIGGEGLPHLGEIGGDENLHQRGACCSTAIF